MRNLILIAPLAIGWVANGLTTSELSDPNNHRHVTTGEVVGIQNQIAQVKVSDGFIYFNISKLCSRVDVSDRLSKGVL
jgi:hypothetical protein